MSDSPTVRGKNRYRVQGTSVSGRGYQDFVFGNTEAEAREGALRERGFRYVTCMTLMPSRLEQAIAAWTAAVRRHRTANTQGVADDALIEQHRQLLILIELEGAGVPGASEFIAQMIDLDEAIRLEIHGPYNPKGHTS